jgi:hypothetical protein
MQGKDPNEKVRWGKNNRKRVVKRQNSPKLTGLIMEQSYISRVWANKIVQWFFNLLLSPSLQTS